uniref:Uncharacterized protein n=1 Tax=Anguilla anguilla TaxID=7936 RepID=A0A0E9QWG3_ANGAN
MYFVRLELALDTYCVQTEIHTSALVKNCLLGLCSDPPARHFPEESLLKYLLPFLPTRT